MKDDPLLIQSVDRAMTLIDIVSKAGENGIPLKDISQQIDVNSSTVHHLLATLSHHHVIDQDLASKRYHLGIRLIEWGKIALGNTSLTQVALPYMERIFNETGYTVSLLMFKRLLRIPLFEINSRQMLSANSAPLDFFTLHATGSGKLLLAFLPESDFKNFLATTNLERFTSTTITDPIRLSDELVNIRDRGIAFDREEYGQGVSCISVPVKDASRRVIACIDMVFPLMNIDEKAMQSMAAVMARTASELSIQVQKMGLTVPK